MATKPLPTPSPEVVPTIQVAKPAKIEIPSIGLASHVVSFRMPDGSFDPGPGEVRPVYATNYGSPIGGNNATYIGGHSSRVDAGMVDTVFNSLFDRPSQSSRVHVGDEIIVTTELGQRACYEVTNVDRVQKSWLQSSAASDYWFWVVKPGSLRVMTCAQYNWNQASDWELVIGTDPGYLC